MGLGAHFVRLLNQPWSPACRVHEMVCMSMSLLIAVAKADAGAVCASLVFSGVLEALAALLKAIMVATKVGVPVDQVEDVKEVLAEAIQVYTALAWDTFWVQLRFQSVPGVCAALEVLRGTVFAQERLFVELDQINLCNPRGDFELLQFLPVASNVKCSICMEGYLEGDADGAGAGAGAGGSADSDKAPCASQCVVAPCWHPFHVACLGKWFEASKHDKCPECTVHIKKTLKKMLTEGPRYSF
jgi:hypothetical protein